MIKTTISAAELKFLMDGIARAVATVTTFYTEEFPDIKYVEDVTREITTVYLMELGIDNIKNE